MNIKQLKSLIAKGESDTLEFKTSAAQLKSVCETLCGYLNAKGGTVLIGVRNNGEIIGQDVTDNTKQEIANELRKLEPTPQITVEYIKIGSKEVIAMQTPAGKHVPYVYDGRPFERTQSSKGRMTQHHYEQLLIQRGQLNHSWEEFPANNYDINSLDQEEILRTIHEGIQANRIPPSAIKDNIVDALERFELLLDGGTLKNAAVLLFAKKLFPQYAQSALKMGRFKGANHLGDFIDNQQVYGNIFKLLAAADDFLMRHLPVASIFKHDQLKRTDKPILPMLAVREALVNALCHKDYSELNSATTLSIFDDRLEIWNCGTLTPKLMLSDLKKPHKSFPRNKIIANVLYVREFFEKWGTGTTKMINLCKEYNLPDPEFEEYSGGLAVTFKFSEIIGASSKNVKRNSLPIRQKAILAIIKQHNGISTRQILAELNHTISRRTIQVELEHLKKGGFIMSEGAGRNTLWVGRQD